jgi:hypothetical protein
MKQAQFTEQEVPEASVVKEFKCPFCWPIRFVPVINSSGTYNPGNISGYQ